MTMLETTVAQKSAALHTNDNRGAALSWTQQDPLLRELWAQNMTPEAIADRLHRSVAAVMTRAARLGLPRRFAPGRKPLDRAAKAARIARPRASKVISEQMFKDVLGTGTAKMMRTCLMCVSPFQSHGAHNRICPKCKGSPDYESGSRLNDADYTF